MKELISELFTKIQGEASSLEKLLARVPGLSGYMEKGQRRNADQMLRHAIANRLEETRLSFSSVHQEIGSDIIKAIDHAEALGQVDTQFMGLIGKIKDAPAGYAGFFDAIKVKEADLARIYAFDEKMLAHVDQIDAATAVLTKAARDHGDLNPAIKDLSAVLRQAGETFASRDEIIVGIGEEL